MEKELVNSGIYCIETKNNNTRYIGSAVNLYMRQAQHFSELKNNKHKNIHLQRAYNKYGKDEFSFEVLEYVENVNDLIEREQWWIDNSNKRLYNLNPIAGSVLGYTWKLSEHTKMKMSVAQTGNTKPYKPVVQKAMTGEVIKEWESPSVVEMELGYQKKMIYSVCQGKRKTAYGYKWEYKL